MHVKYVLAEEDAVQDVCTLVGCGMFRTGRVALRFTPVVAGRDTTFAVASTRVFCPSGARSSCRGDPTDVEGSGRAAGVWRE